MDEVKKQIKEFMLQLMENDFKKYESFAPDAVRKARACMKHIKCLGCLDTNSVLHTTNGYIHGIYYDEYTCNGCTNGGHNYLRRHNYLTDAVGYKNRQIPCNDLDKRNTYSHTGNLAKIYQIEFEAVDKAKEAADKAEQAANEKLLELQDREYKLKLEEARIIAEREALNGEKIPQWAEQRYDELERTKTSVDISVDIQKLVSDVMQIIAISTGNIAGLPTLLSGLDASLKLCWSTQKGKNYYSNIVKDDNSQNVYVRFDYRKVVNEKSAVWDLIRAKGSGKKEFLFLSYLVLKPLNQAANLECIEMMSKDFDTLRTNCMNYKK